MTFKGYAEERRIGVTYGRAIRRGQTKTARESNDAARSKKASIVRGIKGEVWGIKSI